MKFEMLLKIPRSARTIQLVINVPKATTPMANFSIAFSAPISLNDIPACSSGTASLTGITTKAAQIYAPIKLAPGIPSKVSDILVQSMYFVDANGLDWEYSGVGKLELRSGEPQRSTLKVVAAQ